MNPKNMYKILVFSFFVSFSSAVIVVPAPNLAVESATPYTVTLNWTTPINELYDSFTVEVFSMNTRIRVFSVNSTRTVVEGLDPGFLYSFIVRTVRGNLQSDNSNVLQDTAPLPPTNLRLETFNQLLVSIDGIFGEIVFTIDAPGIKATWEGPFEGVCDCYLASISPDEGRVATSTGGDRILPRCHEIYCSERRTQEFSENDATLPQANRIDRSVTTVREFIELSPGKTYTISVRSTTCSHGFLGSLQSDPVSATTTLPPADPPRVIVEEITTTTTYISWEEFIPGFFDGFQVSLVSGTGTGIIIETPSDPRTQGRNVTGLKPCTTYEFEVFTVYELLTSMGSQSVEVTTRPTPPTNLVVTDFTESSISLRWRYFGSQRTAGFEVAVENVMSLIRPSTSRTATLESLQPGTYYTVSVTAQCLGSERVSSDPAQVVQVTVPLPPKDIFSNCAIVPDEKNPDTFSQISMTWEEPRFGDWDGFVLHYSPHLFENGVSSPQPPVLLERDAFALNITVPTVGRIFTGQIRSVKENVLSRAETMDIACRDRVGESSLRCVVPSLKWTIVITEINITHLYVEVTELPLQNITVKFCSTCDVEPQVTSSHKFFTRNPCNLPDESSPELLITVYPICKEGLLCSPVRRRKFCPKTSLTPPENGISEERLATSLPDRVTPDACCNGRSYYKSASKCCHGKLKSLEVTNLLCCYTRWYDRTTQRCCGQRFGEGYVKSSNSECI